MGYEEVESEKGKARSGLSQSGEKSSRFSLAPSLAHKETSAKVQEKDLCSGPQINRPRNEGIQG